MSIELLVFPLQPLQNEQVAMDLLKVLKDLPMTLELLQVSERLCGVASNACKYGFCIFARFP